MADSLRPAPPEFAERLARLAEAHHPHLRQARFKVEVRDTTPTIQFVESWAEVDTPDNDNEAAEFDFTMWFALDAWAKLDDFQRDALTDHELYHCQFDDSGKPRLAPHNIEEFDDVLARYGLWWPDSAKTRAALEQMPAPQGPEGKNSMPQGYQRPMYGGSSGSTGAGGSSGSTGAGGSSGSTGAFADPHLAVGSDFMTVPIGDGRTIDLCPACYAQLAAFVFDQAKAAMGGDMPAQGGSSGSTGA